MKQTLIMVILLVLATLACASDEGEARPSLTPLSDQDVNATLTMRSIDRQTRPPTNTPRPTNNSEPEEESDADLDESSSLETRYISGSSSSVNLRAGPSTDDDIVGRLNFGDEIKILQEQNDWYKIEFETEAWVFAPLTLDVPPIANITSSDSVPTQVVPTQADALPPTQAPQQQQQPTNPPPPTNLPPPTNPPAPPPPPAASCGGATTCSQMASCEQAYACLATNGRLDRDNDGVPCESICPGG